MDGGTGDTARGWSPPGPSDTFCTTLHDTRQGRMHPDSIEELVLSLVAHNFRMAGLLGRCNLYLGLYKFWGHALGNGQQSKSGVK